MNDREHFDTVQRLKCKISRQLGAIDAQRAYIDELRETILKQKAELDRLRWNEIELEATKAVH